MLARQAASHQLTDGVSGDSGWRAAPVVVPDRPGKARLRREFVTVEGSEAVPDQRLPVLRVSAAQQR